MPAEVLLPSFAKVAHNTADVKTDKSAKSVTCDQGFSNTLKAVNSSKRQSKSLRDSQVHDCIEGSTPPTEDSQDAGMGEKLLSMPIIKMPIQIAGIEKSTIEEIPPNEMLINETSLEDAEALLMADGQPQALPGILVSETLPGLTLSHTAEISVEENIVVANSVMMTEEGGDDNTLKGTISGNQHKLPQHQGESKSSSARIVITEESREGLRERRSVAKPTTYVNQFPKVSRSDAYQSSQLIVEESERLRGVVQLSSNTEGIETTRNLPNNTINVETMLMADKAGLPEKEVSTEKIIEQIVKNIEPGSSRKFSTVTIKLQPEFLGKLHISLEVKGNEVVARFSTDNQQVKHLLETGIGQLRTHLEVNGMRLERVEVSIDLGNYSGEFQHSDQSGYHNRQPTYYEASNHYAGQLMSEALPSEIVSGDVLVDDYYDGSINYLI